MKASIIITSFNRPELLFFGLGSFIKQNLSKDDTEIIVLNDGHPNDGTKEVCDRFEEVLNIRYFAAQYRDQHKWRIPGFAINYGVKQSKGEFIFISCAEMYHFDNTIENMIPVLEKNRTALTIPNYAKDDDGTLLNMIKKGELITDDDLAHLEPLHNIHLPFFMGMEKSRFVNIGGYDEDFTGCGFDDNDITDRLVKSGNRHYRVPCRIVHLYHPRLSFSEPKIRSQFNYNNQLYASRRGQVVRNKNREWGQSF